MYPNDAGRMANCLPVLSARKHRIITVSRMFWPLLKFAKQYHNVVFLFSILGMGAGSFELGKLAGKVKNWEKLRSMKSAKPTYLQIVTN